MLLLGAIGVIATRGTEQRGSSDRTRLGWLLVAIPLPLAVSLHLTADLPTLTDQSVFLFGVVAFALGVRLILSAPDDGDLRAGHDDEPPPWWPEFEREFWEYTRRTPSPNRGTLVHR